jgi:DNA-binding transcriptional ArsR family regulator
MSSISYIISPTVKSELETIEKRRRETLLVLIPPRSEIRLKFENETRVIASTLFLAGRSISAREVGQILMGKTKTIPLEVAALKKAHDELRINWLLTDKRIDYEAIRSLIKILSKNEVSIKRTDIDNTLQFIELGEHPIIQMALSFILFYNLLPKSNDRVLISLNISKGFAYMHGFDFRGLINFEEYMAGDLIGFEKLIKGSLAGDSLSEFIEYFIQTFGLAAEKIIPGIRENIKPPAYIPTLSKRQEKILLMFEIPNARITNREVKKEYGISQITASRDLSLLYSLGLIFKKGQGRSVYYVKV